MLYFATKSTKLDGAESYKGLTNAGFLRIFTSQRSPFSNNWWLRENARHLHVRLGGGFRGPGPRANVGLEKAVSKEAAFFCCVFLQALLRGSATLGTTKITLVRPCIRDKRLAYWRANLRLVAVCLLIWFVCSYGFGILLVEQLNQIRIGGFKLGFWFAQQGSIYIFVAADILLRLAHEPHRSQKYDVHED